jgi:hypothetical protein
MKSRAQVRPVISKAEKLTNDWREKVKAEKVRLNRSGLPKVTIKELIERGRKEPHLCAQR